MNIIGYEKKLDDVIEKHLLDWTLTRRAWNSMAARAQAELLKEIALCIAGNTQELIEIRIELGRISENKL